MSAFIRKSIYGTYLEVCKQRGKTFFAYPNTTLNEKFNIKTNNPVQSYEMPNLSYMAIGNGGHEYYELNGHDKIKELAHAPQHAALYNHIPFILRPIDDDIDDDMISNYRLRTQIKVNGIDYIAYYLKKIDFDLTMPYLLDIEINNSETKTNFYYPAEDVLTPKYNEIYPNIIKQTNKYITITDVINLSFTEDEFNEILNVYQILYGVDSIPIISEIGLVSGIDRLTTRTVNDVILSYQEALATQINYFINVSYNIQNILNDDENTYPFNIQFEIGGLEPIYKY